MSLSEGTSSMQGVQPVQEDVLTKTYSILVLELLHNFYLGTSKLLKEFTFTHLESGTIRSQSGKPVHEIRLFSKMRTSILRVVNLILAVM